MEWGALALVLVAFVLVAVLARHGGRVSVTVTADARSDRDAPRSGTGAPDARNRDAPMGH